MKGGLLPERIGLPRSVQKYHTTGFTKAEITELCARIEARELSPRVRRWRPILGLHNALTVTLTYLRRNRVQAEIAENYGVSQPTISRAISAITPLMIQALLDYVPRPMNSTSEHDRGRHTAPVLVVEGAPGIVLREAQDDRNERTGRLHHYRMPGMDLRPDPRALVILVI